MSDELVGIRILGLPVDIFVRSRQHHDELFREFALIAIDPGQAESVPARLLALIDELRSRFSAFTTGASAELEAAVERGDPAVDLAFQVPRDVAQASRAFKDLLAEADDYCRQGELLTLQPTPEGLAFREWYLDEFIRQAAGDEPIPWPAVLS